MASTVVLSSAKIPTGKYQQSSSMGKVDERYQHLISIMQKSVELAESEKQKLSDRLSEIDRTGEELKSEIDRLQLDMEELRKCNGDQSEKMVLLQRTIDEREVAIVALQNKLDEMDASLKHILTREIKHKTKIADQQDQIKVLTKSVHDKSSEIDSLNAQVTRLKRSENERTTKIKNDGAKIKQLDSVQKKLQDDNAKLKQEIEALKKKDTTNSDKIKLQEIRIRSMQEELDAKQEMLINLDKSYWQLLTKLREIEDNGIGKKVGDYFDGLFKSFKKSHQLVQQRAAAHAASSSS